MEDPLFIASLKTGDREAFARLVSELQGRIFNTCISIVQNTEDAEDLTQEVFTEVFHSISGFKNESKLSTWIYRIAVTKSLDFLRRKNRKKRFGFLQSLFNSSDELRVEVADFYHPGVSLENKERSAILFRAIENLPERQKTAFVLSKVEELSYSEIAEIMKISVSAVDALLSRARQNLRDELNNYYKNER